MKLLLDPQAFARRFNEDESVWRCYEHKRELRRLLGLRLPISEEAHDLDWFEAEREYRKMRCIGKPTP